jgi:glycosyltransferase involved in cell wall biosynthesis
MIINGVHGYVFKDINYDLIVKKVEVLLTNDEVFEAMKLNVMKLSNELSWDNHVKKLSDILLKLGNPITKGIGLSHGYNTGY